MSDANQPISTTRESMYNARVQHVRLIHPGLMVIRVVPDEGIPSFDAGQYATLGLGTWERRVDQSPDAASADSLPPRLIRRAYSVSCPLLDDNGTLVTCAQLEFLEFYISLVSHPDDTPPHLTPRLFALTEGCRLHVAPHIRGTYTLGPVAADDAILLLATGTGEAPHNAMLAELLRREHAGPILSAVCVRYRADLGYLAAHRQLERRYPHYRYLPLTTREAQNLEVDRPDYVGRQYLQDVLLSGRLEAELGRSLDPLRTHVYLCGNPDMIGLPRAGRTGRTPPPPPGGMIALLTARGLHPDRPGERGNIHCETYW